MEYKQVQELTRVGYELLIYRNGDKEWYKDGVYHREDGPAVEYADGNKYWYKDGKRHREDGPAIERKNGDKVWYLNGNEVPEEEFNKVLTCPLSELPLYLNTVFEPIVRRRLEQNV